MPNKEPNQDILDLFRERENKYKAYAKKFDKSLERTGQNVLSQAKQQPQPTTAFSQTPPPGTEAPTERGMPSEADITSRRTREVTDRLRQESDERQKERSERLDEMSKSSRERSEDLLQRNRERTDKLLQDFLGSTGNTSPSPVGTGGGIDSFMNAIGFQESSGNYNAVNEQTGALGKYQILPSNWNAWAAEAGIPGADWRDPQNQETVARNKMLQYYNQFGSWEAVAVAWFAGPGAAQEYLQNPEAVLNRSDGGLNVRQYIEKIREGMGQFSQVIGPVVKPEGQNGRLSEEYLTPADDQGNLLQLAAAQSWRQMAADAAQQGITLRIGNSYRTLQKQNEMVDRYGLYGQGGLAAVPGTSNHGWGLAVDIDRSPGAVEWLQENASNYGWNTIPREPWHWEFSG